MRIFVLCQIHPVAMSASRHNCLKIFSPSNCNVYSKRKFDWATRSMDSDNVISSIFFWLSSHTRGRSNWIFMEKQICCCQMCRRSLQPSWQNGPCLKYPVFHIMNNKFPHFSSHKMIYSQKVLLREMHLRSIQVRFNSLTPILKTNIMLLNKTGEKGCSKDLKSAE